MRKKSVIIFLSLIMVASLLFTGCGNDNKAEIEVEKQNTNEKLEVKDDQTGEIKEELEVSEEICYEIIEKKRKR